jgi:uncharacterized peroxidase-related enzyme
MPHITVDQELPGIVALMKFKPASGTLLSQLAQQLLRGESPLTPFERELIAVRVSRGNECRFCEWSHAGAARALADGDEAGLAQRVAGREPTPELDARMHALLAIADLVRERGDRVRASDIEAARAAGADDETIHDTVLIAAAFCMYNRYVDGLGAMTPPNGAAYDEMGEMLATAGYVR